MQPFTQAIESVGMAIDGAGVLVVAGGILFATVRYVRHATSGGGNSYRLYRQDIGRSILLGLEFLVAGDIIRTVVVEPTIDNVIILGLIVLIRTFLSMSLQLEVDGRWPWQSRPARPVAPSA